MIVNLCLVYNWTMFARSADDTAVIFVWLQLLLISAAYYWVKPESKLLKAWVDGSSILNHNSVLTLRAICNFRQFSSRVARLSMTTIARFVKLITTLRSTICKLRCTVCECTTHVANRVTQFLQLAQRILNLAFCNLLIGKLRSTICKLLCAMCNLHCRTCKFMN